MKGVIYARYSSDNQREKIVNTINEQGLRNRKGKPFSISVVSKILTNRRYIGE